jgi:hypothetical protein
MTKLAVRKEASAIPCGGFHYMLHPLKMGSDTEAAIFDQMGYVIIEVADPQAATLLDAASAALRHQVDVAGLTEKALAAKK